MSHFLGNCFHAIAKFFLFNKPKCLFKGKLFLMRQIICISIINKYMSIVCF